jgi:hypothetical protein
MRGLIVVDWMGFLDFIFCPCVSFSVEEIDPVVIILVGFLFKGDLGIGYGTITSVFG